MKNTMISKAKMPSHGSMRLAPSGRTSKYNFGQILKPKHVAYITLTGKTVRSQRKASMLIRASAYAFAKKNGLSVSTRFANHPKTGEVSLGIWTS